MSTLKLNDIDAVIMSVAKGSLNHINCNLIQALQLAVAVYAGLRDPKDVRKHDLLSMTAKLHDKLTSEGLLKHSAISMLETLHSFDTYDAINFGNLSGPKPTSAFEIVLSGWISAITLMQIRRDNQVLIEWESGLPVNFKKDAEDLWEKYSVSQRSSDSAETATTEAVV